MLLNFMRYLTIAILLLVSTSSHAQNNEMTTPVDPESLRATAVRTDQTIEIDGRFDEDAWQTAPVHGDFTQREPNAGEPASLPTEFRILFDEDTFYVAIRAFDDQPEQIVAYLSRRDVFTQSDWLTFFVGPLHDRRTAFEFAVNPSEVKRDIRHTNDTNGDASWDAVWDVATDIDDEGWVAEYAIPLSQLPFDSADGSVWDFQVGRWNPRTNEESIWAYTPPEESGWVSNFGTLDGLEGLEPPHQLELLPYMMGGVDLYESEEGNPFRTGTDWLYSVGGDMTYGLTSETSLALTINPDFGQIEADPATLNLSAFETYQSERRPFFTEGSSSFSFFGPQMFYSRRIGRQPQLTADDRGGYAEDISQTTILGAVRLTGTAGSWSIGLLDALTDREAAEVVDENGENHESLVEPLSNYFVGRLQYDFEQTNTVVGGLYTMVFRDMEERTDLHDQAYTGGLDWDHRWDEDNWSFRGYGAFSHVGGEPESILELQQSSARYFQRPDADHISVDPERESLTGFAGQAEIARIGGNWRGNTGITTRSPEFEINDLGFMQNVDTINAWLNGSYRDLDPGDLVREWYASAWTSASWNYGWEYKHQYLGADIDAQFLNYWGVWLGTGIGFPALCTGCTRGGVAMQTHPSYEVWAGFYSDSTDSVHGSFGAWYWTQPTADSYGFGLDPYLNGRIARFLEVQLGPSYEYFVDDWMWVEENNDEYVFARMGRHTVALSLRINLSFTPDLTLEYYAQPYLSLGQYTEFQRVAEPLARDYGDQFDSLGVIDRNDGVVEVDADGDGLADMFLGEPDFNSLELRSNFVLRWEWLPGSTLFLVWQHNRSGDGETEDFDLGRDVGDLFGGDADSQHVVMLKANWWTSF